GNRLGYEDGKLDIRVNEWQAEPRDLHAVVQRNEGSDDLGEQLGDGWHPALVVQHAQYYDEGKTHEDAGQLLVERDDPDQAALLIQGMAVLQKLPEMRKAD